MFRKILGLAAIGAVVALIVSAPAYAKPVPGYVNAPPQRSEVASGGTTSHVGRDVAIGIVGFSAVVLVALGVTVPSRRQGFSPA